MKLSDYIEALKNKRVTVIGMGVSNTPLIGKLLDNGIDVTIRDKNSFEKLGEAAVSFRNAGAHFVLGEDYLDNIGGDVIFRTPGLNGNAPGLVEARKRGSVVTSEMEAFFEVCPCRIIGVTGSDGKTTTTTIISELLKAEGKTVYVGGNIGTPLLCQADAMDKDGIAVLELSSFQLMTMKSSPETAVVTNVAPNHLDVHKDMDEYVSAKKNLIAYQKAGNRVVLNYDNDITRGFAETAKADVMLFSRKEKTENGYFCDGNSIFRSENGIAEKIIDTAEILIPGVHNVENYMAAFAAVDGEVSKETMVKVARTFKGVEHRIELVRVHKGVSYYNDSIASSPSRTIAGLRSFKQKVILIAGGKDKGVPFDVLGDEIMLHTKALFLTGLTAEKLKSAVTNSKLYSEDYPISIIDGFEDTVRAAADFAKEGDVVILSPACTSFDRFKNFMERGQRFKDAVNELE